MFDTRDLMMQRRVCVFVCLCVCAFVWFWCRLTEMFMLCCGFTRRDAGSRSMTPVIVAIARLIGLRSGG